MKLGDTPIVPMAKKIANYLAKHGRGAVILSPSGPAADKWTDIATYPNSSTAMTAQIIAMQAGTSFGPIVLANRYDRIDLAGNACRFLLMDNLPRAPRHCRDRRGQRPGAERAEPMGGGHSRIRDGARVESQLVGCIK
jgi:hypothetical protein